MGLPLWIRNLKDEVLRDDFTEIFRAGGPITEAEMGGALTDLSKELKSDGENLSESQVRDLKRIADHINGGSLHASDYLKFIANAFVNGSAANATWTGGLRGQR